MLVLKQIHKQLTKAATEKRDEVLKTLALSSPTKFYDIIDGKRECSDLEKEAIAKIYDVPSKKLFSEVKKKEKTKRVTPK